MQNSKRIKSFKFLGRSFELTIDDIEISVNVENRIMTDIEDFTPYLKDDYVLDFKLTETTLMDLIDLKKLKFYYVYEETSSRKFICLLSNIDNLKFEYEFLEEIFDYNKKEMKKGRFYYAKLMYGKYNVIDRFEVEDSNYVEFLNRMLEKIKQKDSLLSFNRKDFLGLFPSLTQLEILEVMMKKYIPLEEFERGKPKNLIFVKKYGTVFDKKKIYIKDPDKSVKIVFDGNYSNFRISGDNGVAAKIECDIELFATKHLSERFSDSMTNLLEYHFSNSEYINEYYSPKPIYDYIQHLFSKTPWQKDIYINEDDFIDEVFKYAATEMEKEDEKN